MAEWERLWTPLRWQSVLAHGTEERELEAIRQATKHGSPLGGQEFVAEFEFRAGQAIAGRKIGRPRLVPGGAAATPSPGRGTLSD
jgi:hypothetical protein